MKKIISFILSLVVLANIPVAFAESKLSENTTEALEILQVLGFLNDDYNSETIDVNTELTRAEFADIAGKIFNVSGVSGDVLYFHDVPRDYYAYDSITYLTNIGAISGNGEKQFHPDDKISVTDASKIILCALKYGPMIEAFGGYPNGVVKVATDVGLYKNVNAINGNLTYAGMFQLLYNAVLTEVPKSEYDNSPEETYLGESYGIYLEKGIVTGVDGADFGNTASDRGQVVINTTIFEADGKDYVKHLGNEVLYLYKYDKKMDEYHLIWMKDTGKDECIELSYRKDGVSFNQENYKLSYWTENGRAKTLDILKNVKVIYNGKLLTSGGVNAVLGSEFDTIKLFESEGSNYYDLAIVYGYENCVVDIIDVENECVYDKETNKKVDFSEYKEIFIHNSDGSLIEFSQIPIGTVLSVYPSWDKDVANCYVVNSIIEGTVNAVSEKDDYVEYMIDDKAYVSYKDFGDVRIGSGVKVWLDINGYIEKLEYTDGVEKYAYLIDMYADETVSEELWFKLFMQNGGVVKYKCSDRVVIDGASFKKTFPLGVYNYFGGKNMESQLIRVVVDDADEISMIDTVSEDSKSDFRCTHEKKGRQYKGGKFVATSAIGSLINDSSTIIFQVPSDPKNAEDWEFGIVRQSSITDWFSTSTQGFSSEEDSFVCEAVIMHGTDLKNSTGSRYLMVNKVKTVLNDDDEAVKQIEGYYGSNEYAIKTTSEIENIDVKRGDIIYITYNNKGEVAGLDVRYRHNETNLPSFIYDHVNNYNFFGAYVYDAKSGIIKVTNTPDGKTESDIYKVGTIWIYDSAHNEVRKGTSADLIGSKTAGKGTPVVMYTSQGYVSTTFAFK